MPTGLARAGALVVAGWGGEYATDMPLSERIGRDGRIRTADLLTPSQAR